MYLHHDTVMESRHIIVNQYSYDAEFMRTKSLCIKAIDALIEN